MPSSAVLTVTAGPDRGQVFELAAELTHIGCGDGNEIVLTDPGVDEHAASIAERNGRFAIYTTRSDAIAIDGAKLPSERWAWLPERAEIQLGAGTLLEFRAAGDSQRSGAAGRPNESAATSPRDPTSEGTSAATATATGTKSRRQTAKGRRSPPRRRRESGQVAKFITDRPGDPLVRLGEDGQLPVLSLQESQSQSQQSDNETRESSPLMLYGVLALSMLMSVGLLLIDISPGGATAADRSEARRVVSQFYDSEPPLEPYQLLLRDALVAESRGDVAAARRKYRQVLDLLNSADVVDPANLNGLTGRHTNRGRASDEDLRVALETLLAR